MTTRAIIRQLLIRAGILILATILVLVSMNLITDSRIELQRQRGLQEKHAAVLPADRYEEIALEDTGASEAGIVAAYVARNTNSEITGYVIESIVHTNEGDFLMRTGISSDGSMVMSGTANARRLRIYQYRFFYPTVFKACLLLP